MEVSRWLETTSLIAGAVSTGVMAGVYFTFSSFVMRSLDALKAGQGAAAMQSINKVILESPFMPLFFGTTLISLGLAGWGCLRWGQPGAWAMVLGGLVYVVGMFVVTAAGNVPLNEQLGALDAAAPEAQGFWRVYLRKWTLYNPARSA